MGATKQELRDELDRRGIAYPDDALRDDLERLLVEAPAGDAQETASPANPDPAPNGFGPTRRRGGSISNLSRLRKD